MLSAGDILRVKDGADRKALPLLSELSLTNTVEMIIRDILV